MGKAARERHVQNRCARSRQVTLGVFGAVAVTCGLVATPPTRLRAWPHQESMTESTPASANSRICARSVALSDEEYSPRAG